MKHIKLNCKSRERIPSLKLPKFTLLLALLATSMIGVAQNPVLKVFEDWNDTSGTQNSFIKTMVRSRGLSGTTYYYTCGATLNSSGNYDIFLQKQTAMGVTVWTETYDHNGGNDVATDVQIDGSGNVYLCGAAFKDATDSTNGMIIKYNSSGTQQWLYEYNGSGSANDGFSTLALSSTAVFAVGSAYSGSSNTYDFLAVKVSTSSGTASWETEWDYSGMNDAASNLYKLSGTTALFVAGAGQTSTTDYDYVVNKIDPASGGVTLYTNVSGSSIGFDQVTGIQQDANSNIYVTGSAFDATTLYDFKTVALDSELNLLWTSTYDAGNNLNDNATGLYLDANGNVIVTGSSETPSEGRDYTTIKYDPNGNQMWVANYNNSAVNKNDSATAIVVDENDTDKIYVTGYSDNGSSKDYYTIRYDGAGNELWEIGFNDVHDLDDRAFAIALDTIGGIVVSGQCGSDNNMQFITVRYGEDSLLTPTSSENLGSAFWLTENRGQLRTTDDKPTSVKYYNKTGGNQQQVYFFDNKLSYVWAKLDTAQAPTNDTLFRVDQTFRGGNYSPIHANGLPRPNYENFFLSWCPKGCSRMKTYDGLFRSKIYDGVDVVYSSNVAGMKYSYVMQPGVSPTTVQEVYSGADSIRVNGSGDLIIYTYLGNIQRPKPTVWEVKSNGTDTALSWQPGYSVSGDTVSFTSLGTYNSAYAFIMEIKNAPVNSLSNHITGTSMDWSTHYGHLTQQDPFTAVRADSLGNSYYGGYVCGNGFPFTAGALQANNLATWDFDFVKVNPNATPGFSTYCGGDGFDQIHLVMDLDTADNVYFAGYSGSDNFPVVNPGGAFCDSTIHGNTAHDMIIGKINSIGTQILWATYYGGSANEYPNGIAVTPSGDRVAVVGELSGSTTNFPVHSRPGSFSSSTGLSFIVDFDSQYDTVMSTQFATYGRIKAVDFDDNGNMFITGKNDGSNGNFPFAHQIGSYWDSIAVYNAFITRFDTNDSITWSTAFGGYGGGMTEGTAILCNRKGVYVAGNTNQNDTTFPLMHSAGEFIDDSVNTNNPDMWIARFTVSGFEKWCTLYGQGSIEQATNLCTDDNNTVYLVGTSESSNFDIWFAGNDYVQYQANSLSPDGVIVAFSQYNTRRWSTCFGGTDFEFINGVAASGDSTLFITGSSQSTPATYPWNYPNLVPGEVIDTLKTNNVATGFMARFNLKYVTVGIDETHPVSGGDFLIYPNPTSGNLMVQVNDLKGEDVRLTVYDLLGQVIMDRKTQNNFGTLQEPLDLENLSNGVYLVSVQIGDRMLMTKKVIKQQ